MQKIKVELTFPPRLKNEAVICNLCKKFNVTVNILEASFSTETGWAIIIIEGTEIEVTKALEFLKAKDVEVKDTQRLI